MNATSAASGELNGWRAVRSELARRTQRPSKQFVFWAYFMLSVAGLGGLGLWVELVQINGQDPAERDWNNAYTALVTFFPALIGSSCLQMVFETRDRRMLAFALICFAVALVVGATLISAYRPASVADWFAAILMCFGSLWVWWISNADNTALHDDPEIDAPVGGNPDAPLGGGFGEMKV